MANPKRQTSDIRRQTSERFDLSSVFCPLSSRLCLLTSVVCLLFAGCGYTTRPGLPSNFRTVYIAPFSNKIDLTQIQTGYQNFPIYRPAMEADVTKNVINRFQFTGLLRPASKDKADTRLEGELVEFRRDALRYSASQNVEEWRLSIVVNVRFYDQAANTLVWEESRLTGDATFFTIGANAKSETSALDLALEDVARRVVERTVESW